jgi:hypothetical protein
MILFALVLSLLISTPFEAFLAAWSNALELSLDKHKIATNAICGNSAAWGKLTSVEGPKTHDGNRAAGNPEKQRPLSVRSKLFWRYVSAGALHAG